MSRLVAYAGEAFEAIWRNRVRSLLTILGMIIGTASIIGVLGISRAAQSGIGATLAQYGDTGVLINVDQQGDDPAGSQIQFRDVRTVLAANPGSIDRAFPVYQRTYRLRANGVTYDTFVTSANDVHVDSLTLFAGRRIDGGDVASASHVAVIKQDLAERFFHRRDPVGERLRIGGSRFRIVGVYNRDSSSLSSTISGSEYVEIPYTTFHQIAPGPVDFLQVYPRSGITPEVVMDAGSRSLQRIHGNRSRYVTQDSGAFLDGFNRVLGVIGTGLAAIGGVSLLVAGIGIMNIMLVSVTERTREIGLRKSIGAKRADITLQFLIEAILLSMIGGGIGTVIGLLVTIGGYVALERFVGPAPIPYLLVVSIAVGFSTLVGTVFGTYPALRAGRMDPIEALRS